MAEETTLQFLSRREKELLARISALKGQLAPMEAELSQVQIAKRALEMPTTNLLTDMLPPKISNSVISPMATVPYATALESFMEPATSQLAAYDRYAQMTIKELIVQALLDGFSDGGTLSQIRDFIFNGYDRPIEGASLRAQMQRMKADHVLTQNGEIWNLTPRKRIAYMMFDHPSSRVAMTELRDDIPDRDSEPTED